MRLKLKKSLYARHSMSLIRVWTDVGADKPVSLIARIIDTKNSMYIIQYLSPTDHKDHGRTVYRYEDETYEIDDDSVTHYLDTDDESEIGFKRVESGWIRDRSELDDGDESDYVPSDEEDDDGSDEEDAEDEESMDIDDEDDVYEDYSDADD